MKFASWSNTTGLVAGCYALCASALGGVSFANEPVPIAVAAYEFPPYYSSHLERHVLGALLDALNERQNEFQFEVVEVRPPHRYQALADSGCCDLIFFEATHWGWQPHLSGNVGETDVEASGEEVTTRVIQGPQLTRGADIQVQHSETRGEVGGDAQNEITASAKGNATEPTSDSPRLGGIVGYHYEFVDFQNDIALLENEHNLYLADSHVTLINMLRRGRLDRILLNQELLAMMESQRPELADELVTSGTVDQSYVTHVLVADQADINVTWLREQLDEMHETGDLQALFESFGLGDFVAYQLPQEDAQEYPEEEQYEHR